MSAMPSGSSSVSSVPQLALFQARRPRRTAYDVQAVSQPARAFTGDFYFSHQHKDRLWFAVGDVSGKGINAAVLMAMIQEELEHRIASCAATQCDPSVTMQRLHEFLQPLMPQNRFATIVIGHLRDDGLLTIANAGHCPPLIARHDGVIEQVDSTGPVAGLLRQSRWHSVTRAMQPGDAILLFSDGVLEAQNRDGVEFGVDRIARALIRASCGRSIIDAVLADAADYCFEDDVTLLAVTLPFESTAN